MNARNNSIFEIQFGKEALCVLMFQRREDESLGVFGFAGVESGKLWSVRELDTTVRELKHVPAGAPLIKEASGMEAEGGQLLVINRINFEQTMVELRELLARLLTESKVSNQTEVPDEIVL